MQVREEERREAETIIQHISARGTFPASGPLFHSDDERAKFKWAVGILNLPFEGGGDVD